jgi:hypothetical protein
MKSVADDLRRQTLQSASLLTAAQRIALALRLGDDDLALYRRMHGLTEEAARASLRRARVVGRVRSRSHDPDAA